MNAITNKITDQHRSKLAIIYIRQSTLQQVHEHHHSTERQYDLAKKATQLGWQQENLEIIDEDQGMSGASAIRRTGFQHMTAEVALGHVGAVFGIEVSRLARASDDWHHLIKLCSITSTLIIDEDGVYDPNDFNDRLILGIKGTISEAELHYLKARMYGGKIKAAQMGTYRFCLPIGFIYTYDKDIVLDPDQQIQAIVQLLFEKFKHLKSARAVVRYFNDHNLHFPRRERNGVTKSPAQWTPLTTGRVRHILRNPMYAGAYAFGRTVSERTMNGMTKERIVPMDEWKVLLKDHHPGYIDWERYLQNIEQLKLNSSQPRDSSAPSGVRNGAALLQGFVYCGLCGHKMQVRYKKKNNCRSWYYICEYEKKSHCGPICQFMRGNEIDLAVGNLFIEAVQHQKLNIAIRVLEKLQDEKQSLFHQLERKLERATYQADRAGRQYHACEPENRLVARTLETQWNESLELVEAITAEIEDLKSNKSFQITPEVKKKINALAHDLPRIWHAAQSAPSDHKHLLRVVIADVTLTRTDAIVLVDVRWKTGSTTRLSVSLLPKISDVVRTSSAAITFIRTHAPEFTDQELADHLNALGFVTGNGTPFTRDCVRWVRRKYAIPSSFPPSPQPPSCSTVSHRYSTLELANALGLSVFQIHYLRKNSILSGKRKTSHGSFLYELSEDDLVTLHTFIQDHTHNGRLRLKGGLS